MRKRNEFAPYTTAGGIIVVLADHRRASSPESCTRSSTRRWAAPRRSSRCSRWSCTPGRFRRSRSSSPCRSIIFAASMTSATNLSVLLPMLPDGSFAARLLGMIDLLLIWQVIVLAIGLARAVPPPHAADRDVAVRGLRRHCGGRRRVHEPSWGDTLSRNKKIIIGRRHRARARRDRATRTSGSSGRGPRSHDRSRPEAAPRGDRVGLGQDPAEARRQHQRRHDGPRHRPRGRRRRSASPRGSSCCRSIRATCGRPCSAPKRRSRRRTRRSSSCKSRSRARRSR